MSEMVPVGRDHPAGITCGLGLPATTYAKIGDAHFQLIGWRSPASSIPHLIMAAAVERFGTVQQKSKWLPRLATGEIRGGLALTEPNAGTDLQAIRTVARKDENGDYILNGTKTWISNALNGHCFALLARPTPPPTALQGHEPVHCRQAGWPFHRQEVRRSSVTRRSTATELVSGRITASRLTN